MAHDWGLRPGTIAVGDSFRLLFITSGERNAASTDIADYDSFVQSQAASGHTDIQAYSPQFKVLGSTAATHAWVHTRTRPSQFGVGEPIYWLNGLRIADDYDDFYDGSWANSSAATFETGAAKTIDGNSFVWTGSRTWGASYPSYALGDSHPELGNPHNGSTALVATTVASPNPPVPTVRSVRCVSGGGAGCSVRDGVCDLGQSWRQQIRAAKRW